MKKNYIYSFSLTLIYLSLIIVGKESATFYCVILFNGFVHGQLFGVLGIVGTVGLTFGLLLFSDQVKFTINLFSIVLMLLSLALLFFNDPSKYNYPTFYQRTPMFILMFFCLFSMFFLLINAWKLRDYFVNKNLS